MSKTSDVRDSQTSDYRVKVPASQSLSEGPGIWIDKCCQGRDGEVDS